MPSEQHEEWHKVHAQLLKSVADAQGRLLAAQNEICDRLDAQMKAVPALQAHRDKQIADLKVLVAQTHEAVHKSHGNLSERLDIVRVQMDAMTSTLLAKTRRPVGRLRTKRIPAAKRNRR